MGVRKVFTWGIGFLNPPTRGTFPRDGLIQDLIAFVLVFRLDFCRGLHVQCRMKPVVVVEVDIVRDFGVKGCFAGKYAVADEFALDDREEGFRDGIVIRRSRTGE